MKIKKNGKVVNLTESDLQKIVKKVINEQDPWTGKGESEESDKEMFNYSNAPSCIELLESQIERQRRGSDPMRVGSLFRGILDIDYIEKVDGAVPVSEIVAYKDGKPFCKFPKR